MGVVLAPAIGPSVGGLLVEAFGWRSVFLMVVPFCLASLYMARRYVPITGPGGALAQPEAALDWRGLLLVSSGAMCVLNGLVALHGDSVVSALGLLALAAGLLVGFVVWQRRLLRQHGRPLLNMHLFGHRQFAMGSLVALIYGTALFGSTYLLPVYLQAGLGMSPAYVGSILLPSGLILGVTIAVVGRLADRHPTWLLVIFGLVLLASSFALMVLLDLSSPLWWLVTFATIGRVGLGFILPSLNLAAMRGLDRPLIAQGSSVINFLRMFGGAAGVSLCGIVLEWRLAGTWRLAHGGHAQCGQAECIQRNLHPAGHRLLAGHCGGLALARSGIREALNAAAGHSLERGGLRLGDRLACRHPGIETTGQRGHVQITHFFHRGSSQRGTTTGLAIQHHLEIAARQLGRRAEFELEHATRGMDGARDMACRELVGFTHIDQHVGVAHHDLGLLHRQFTGQGLGMNDQVMGCFHQRSPKDSARGIDIGGG
jgi:predicted MFS family arabinose efflux permease